jgi:acyl-CoA thioesterase
MYDHDRALHHLGIELVEAAPGRAVTRLVVADHHVNGLDVGHGGVLFTLADAAMAYASNTGLADDEQALATGGEIDFLRPAQVGATLSAEALTIASSGRTSVHDVRISDADGLLVGVFRGRTRRVTVAER